MANTFSLRWSANVYHWLLLDSLARFRILVDTHFPSEVERKEMILLALKVGDK